MVKLVESGCRVNESSIETPIRVELAHSSVANRQQISRHPLQQNVP